MGIGIVPWQKRICFSISAKEIARAEDDCDRTKQGIHSVLHAHHESNLKVL